MNKRQRKKNLKKMMVRSWAVHYWNSAKERYAAVVNANAGVIYGS